MANRVAAASKRLCDTGSRAMRVLKAVLLAALAMSAAAVWAQSARPDPNIGYLFPAGGQRGKVIQITAGGQFLRGATGVFVSGDGVHARVIKHYPPLRNLDPEQRQELQKRMLELRTKRLAEMSPNNPIPSPPSWRDLAGRERERKIRTGRKQVMQSRQHNPPIQTMPNWNKRRQNPWSCLIIHYCRIGKT